jgi:hypothetical protein
MITSLNFFVMTKGHNQLNGTNDIDPENKSKGENRSLSNSARKTKNEREGRSPEKDPSNGRKKNPNAVG